MIAFALLGAFVSGALPLVSSTRTDAGVEFHHNGQLITRYVHAGTPEKPLAKPYCFPLHTPDGVPVTRAWPLEPAGPGATTDHVHQKSLWFCHGDVIPLDATGAPLAPPTNKHVHGTDFWSEAPGHGRIVCDEVAEPDQVAPDHVRVVTRNRWLTAEGQTLLNETRTLHLHALPSGGVLLVFECELKAAVPVRFGDTKEGSFGLRVRDELALTRRGSVGTITSSTGLTAQAPARDDLPLWGEVADWHDYSGTVGDQTIGVALFADPANPLKSAWHTRAYGLMAANPFARTKSGFPGRRAATDEHTLATGDMLTLRFGVFPHTGPAEAVPAAWQAFHKRGQ